MTSIQIVELDDALLVQTVRTPPMIDRALSATSSAFFGWMVGSFAVGRAGAIVGALAAGLVGGVFARRPRRFELRITKTEFVAAGRIGDQFGNSRSVPTAEVQWLEFQEDRSGPETAEHPGGVYAVLRDREMCLLPDVDEQQTEAVIERIREKFPEVCEPWRGRSAFGRNVISLGITDISG